MLKIAKKRTQTIVEIKADLRAKGFADDHVSIDQMMIENRKCPNCQKKLVYHGVSNAEEYHAFGACVCGYAHRFWTEKCVLQVSRFRKPLIQTKETI